MKKILMIHEWHDHFYDMKDTLENYILTFDDGLYSQYKALPFLKTLRTTKIFFISTNIIRPENVTPSDEVLYCGDAHKKAFNHNFENYMSWKEIQEIYKTTFCYIGGHGHDHLKIQEVKGLREHYNLIKDDVSDMIKVFDEQNINIKTFCYPYNYVDGLYAGALNREKEINQYYDGERIAIEDLIGDLIRNSKGDSK